MTALPSLLLLRKFFSLATITGCLLFQLIGTRHQKFCQFSTEIRFPRVQLLILLGTITHLIELGRLGMIEHLLALVAEIHHALHRDHRRERHCYLPTVSRE